MGYDVDSVGDSLLQLSEPMFKNECFTLLQAYADFNNAVLYFPSVNSHKLCLPVHLRGLEA